MKKKKYKNRKIINVIYLIFLQQKRVGASLKFSDALQENLNCVCLL